LNFELPKEIIIVKTEEFRIFSEGIDYLSGFFIGLSELIFLMDVLFPSLHPRVISASVQG